MALHDWTRVDPGIFHDFHVAWIGELRRALNSGVLPADYYALAEPTAGDVVPDVRKKTPAGTGLKFLRFLGIAGSARVCNSARETGDAYRNWARFNTLLDGKPQYRLLLIVRR